MDSVYLAFTDLGECAELCGVFADQESAVHGAAEYLAKQTPADRRRLAAFVERWPLGSTAGEEVWYKHRSEKSAVEP